MVSHREHRGHGEKGGNENIFQTRSRVNSLDTSLQKLSVNSVLSVAENGLHYGVVMR
jgi:hypothetical protein